MEESEQAFDDMIEAIEAIAIFLEDYKKDKSLYNESIIGALLVHAHIYSIASSSKLSLSETVERLSPMFDELVIETKNIQ